MIKILTILVKRTGPLWTCIVFWVVLFEFKLKSATCLPFTFYLNTGCVCSRRSVAHCFGAALSEIRQEACLDMQVASSLTAKRVPTRQATFTLAKHPQGGQGFRRALQQAQALRNCGLQGGHHFGSNPLQKAFCKACHLA